MSNPLLTPTGRKRQFSALFELVDPAVPRWRIKRSGVMGWPLDAPLTEAIVDALQGAGVEVKGRSWGSAANVSSYHLEGNFLDGGISASTGTYWLSPKGAWISGKEAMTFVAGVLGIEMLGLPSD